MSIRPINKELQEVAIKELFEVPERIPKDIAYIKEWLSQQNHIIARTDDQFLLSFLRGCKYSLERTKSKLDMYYTLKTITPEIFQERDPMRPEIQAILNKGILVPLPKLANPSSPRYYLMRNGLVDVDKMKQVDLFKVNTMIQDILVMEDDNFIISGIVGVQDMENLHMGHYLHMSPALVKKMMTCFQQGYPNRIKAMNFFNIPTVFELINKLFMPLLSDKLKKRVVLFSDIEELTKVVPLSVLPEEYGGQGGKIDEITAEWKRKVESYRDWFLEDSKYKTDEKKRPGRPKTSESVFGLEGSFRQLSVD